MRSQRSCPGRLVDDPEHLEPGDLAGILRVSDRRMTIDVPEEACRFIAWQDFDPVYGARLFEELAGTSKLDLRRRR